jgi:hypothetical protein
MSPDQVLVIIAIVTGAWTLTRILRSPLAEALARRLGGGTAGEPGPAHEAELADLRTRVAELEERQDFTERVLLQERQQGELGQGGRA